MSCRTASPMKTATAAHTSTMAAHRAGGICSWKAPQASRNWMVGAMYCPIPTTDNGTRLVPAAKSSRGTAVTGPATTSSARIHHP